MFLYHILIIINTNICMLSEYNCKFADVNTLNNLHHGDKTTTVFHRDS